MAKLDVYLRSIKQLGAQGAVLASGQAVMLRFPTGDRHATQITSHEQVVQLVREVAPAVAREQLDQGRAGAFEIEANGGRWAIGVHPRPGAWQVTIDPVEPAGAHAHAGHAVASAQPPAIPAAGRPVRAATASPSGPAAARATTEVGEDMAIERGQYGGGAAAAAPGATSGSPLLDQLTASARAAHATEVYLSAGSPAFLRVAGQLVAGHDRSPIDGDALGRELGLIAPNDARAAWTERGAAVFAYGDGAGRVRVTLSRDHRGPGATLRLLPAEPPTLAALGLAAVADWLTDRGLIVVGGASGVGKTTTLAALVRAIGELRRRVVTLEDPIELVHVSAWVSQRAVRDHTTSVEAGVAAAMREAADAIVVGEVRTSADAAALFEAVAGGHLVLTSVTSPGAGGPGHAAERAAERVAERVLDRVLDRLPPDQRPSARALCADALLGTIVPVMGRSGRSIEVRGRGVAG